MRRFIPALVFAALATLVTWPLAVSLVSRLGALQGPGDPFLNFWILGWDLQTISNHPSWLLNGRVFNANIFYPATGTLAYSDHQLIQALGVWPVYAVTHNVTLCYNLVVLLSLTLSAWAMFLFVRTATGSTVAAYTAGLVWGFGPYRIAHLLHVQLQALYWMPLTALLLYRLLKTARTRDAVGLGVLAGIQVLSSVYIGLIGGMGLAVAIIVAGVGSGWRPVRRVIGPLLLAAVIAIVVAAPGVWPYWRLQQREGFSRSLFEAGHGSAVLTSYLRTAPTNLIYGQTGWLRPNPDGTGLLNRKNGPEQDLFPGFIVLALAGLGVWRAKRLGAGPLVGPMLAVGVVGFVLSLGPDGVRVLYAALYDWVFGFQAIRAPARFVVLVLFSVSFFAGLGVHALFRRNGAETLWPAALAMTLIIGEFLNGSLPLAAPPPSTTAIGRWLRDAPEPGAVVYLPMGGDGDTVYMVSSLEHGRPIVNGSSGQTPAHYAALMEAMAAFPDTVALLTLHEIDVRFVVTSTPVAIAVSPSPLVERVRYDEGVIYELQWTPEIESTLEDASTTLPPPAGEPPFQVGERITYQVRWLGGPMTIPAGEAVLNVERVDGGGYRFVARAKTADWMRRFFEAEDEVSSVTDAQLRPREYEETLNEGRRHTHRTVRFDQDARRTEITTGEGAAITLPLARDARDPISLFYYIRTLPLAENYQVRMPLNDAGRSANVDVRVAGAETIEIDGRRYETWKVEPRIVNRVQIREPIGTTVWVSRDARKLPLLARVSGPFGAVELKIAEEPSR